MANTYTSLHYHIVFSTRNREPWIRQDIETRVWSFLGGICKTNQLYPIQIGGYDDHVHALIGARPTHSPAEITKRLKGGSSAWISTTFAGLNAFAWQDGYGAFTVSRSAIDEVAAYIRNQREHHKSMTFQEEYIALLKRHGIEYDERYLWG
jgi:REP element-mobilizing transposase RayT